MLLYIYAYVYIYDIERKYNFSTSFFYLFFYFFHFFFFFLTFLFTFICDLLNNHWQHVLVVYLIASFICNEWRRTFFIFLCLKHSRSENLLSCIYSWLVYEFVRPSVRPPTHFYWNIYPRNQKSHSLLMRINQFKDRHHAQKSWACHNVHQHFSEPFKVMTITYKHAYK